MSTKEEMYLVLSDHWLFGVVFHIIRTDILRMGNCLGGDTGRPGSLGTSQSIASVTLSPEKQVVPRTRRHRDHRQSPEQDLVVSVLPPLRLPPAGIHVQDLPPRSWTWMASSVIPSCNGSQGTVPTCQMAPTMDEIPSVLMSPVQPVSSQTSPCADDRSCMDPDPMSGRSPVRLLSKDLPPGSWTWMDSPVSQPCIVSQDASPSTRYVCAMNPRTCTRQWTILILDPNRRDRCLMRRITFNHNLTLFTARDMQQYNAIVHTSTDRIDIIIANLWEGPSDWHSSFLDSARLLHPHSYVVFQLDRNQWPCTIAIPHNTVVLPKGLLTNLGTSSMHIIIALAKQHLSQLSGVPGKPGKAWESLGNSCDAPVTLL